MIRTPFFSEIIFSEKGDRQVYNTDWPKEVAHDNYID